MTRAQLGLDRNGNKEGAFDKMNKNNAADGAGGGEGGGIGLGALEHVFRKVPVEEEEWLDEEGDGLYFTRNNLYHADMLAHLNLDMEDEHAGH